MSFEQFIRKEKKGFFLYTTNKEQFDHPPHVIRTRSPEGVVQKKNFSISVAKEKLISGFLKVMKKAGFRVDEDKGATDLVLSDAAKVQGGKSDQFVNFKPETTEADIALNIKRCVKENKTIVVRGAGSSLTGAVVPKNDVVFGLSEYKKISRPVKQRISDPEKGTRDAHLVTVQAGATFNELHDKLENYNLFLPSAPTFDTATIGGGVNTDAGGARSYKYGKMRNWVQGLKLMLSTGEVIDIKRGQHFAHKGDAKSPHGYFILERKDGTRQRIPVPAYETPTNVPKVSAGIFSKHAKPGERGMDLVDLIVGSEGTLGVVTEVTLEVKKEPPTVMAMVGCDDDKQAIELMMQLRKQEAEKRKTLEPGGISAVEIMGEKAVELLRKNGKNVPKNGKSFLLVQIEVPENFEITDDPVPSDGPANSYHYFLKNCIDKKVSTNNIYTASPDMKDDYDDLKKEFTALREAVPIGVNKLIEQNQKNDKGVTKVGSDACVPPELADKAISLYKTGFSKNGLEWYFWGHGEGNFHVNAVPKSTEETEKAKEIIARVGRVLIKRYKGVGTSEHGVGKNPTKIGLLKLLYGDDVTDKMQEVMDAFDPFRVFGVGNLGKKGAGVIYQK